MRALLLSATLAMLGACSQGTQKDVARRPSAVVASDKVAEAPVAKASPAAGRAAAASDKATKETAKPVDTDDLKAEEQEANPYSETVTLRLVVTPQIKATVTWGAKTLARLEPGKMDTEVVRPRGSGPLDIDVKAEGYMPYHGRLYADRNDTINVRLYRPEEAPNLFGYRRSAEAKKAQSEKVH
jgi:hypothetical protein